MPLKIADVAEKLLKITSVDKNFKYTHPFNGHFSGTTQVTVPER